MTVSRLAVLTKTNNNKIAKNKATLSIPDISNGQPSKKNGLTVRSIGNTQVGKLFFAFFVITVNFTL